MKSVPSLVMNSFYDVWPFVEFMLKWSFRPRPLYTVDLECFNCSYIEKCLCVLCAVLINSLSDTDACSKRLLCDVVVIGTLHRGWIGC